MNWRNLLYFSKGERKALTVLLCLITTAWIILLLTEPAPESIWQESNTNQRQQKPPAPVQQLKEDKKKQVSNNRNQEKAPTGNSPKWNAPKTVRDTNTSYQAYPRTEKYPEGTIVELNTADTTSLKKIPGIGSGFANRIVKYRNLLGGFYSVSQLSEVYGIDEERYNAMKRWFSVDASTISRLYVNHLPADSLRKHPYLNYHQTRIIEQTRKQKGRLSGWENLQLLEEFTDKDKDRLTPYLSFE